ncbi:putative copper homeostasis protein cutC [Rosellinia necatrix]|uniref:Copper homeostasis protein cutC homolog n=1 Tax=Rosellinia necatrix TaxID=77044 RepID=A0A1S7UL83_ROSNE|nr:putative copper homeostasis protein cutC [Rosellinia necatrix]
MATKFRLGLEIPAFGALAASRASRLGATRIELNAEGSYGEGGLTPSFEELKMTDVSCPLRIMIRPRGPPRISSSSEASAVGIRDFQYSDEEFEEMSASVKIFRDSGLLDMSRGDGFVFGILEEEGRANDEGWTGRRRCWVDKKRCTRLVQAARPFKCVFHRAFDEIVSCDEVSPGKPKPARPSWETGLEDVAACGFDGILTSGGLGRAIDNLETLGPVIKRARGLGVEIIIGGGVRTANIGEIRERLALQEIADSVYLHSACLGGDGSEHINHEEVEGILAQLK